MIAEIDEAKEKGESLDVEHLEGGYRAHSYACGFERVTLV